MKQVAAVVPLYTVLAPVLVVRDGRWVIERQMVTVWQPVNLWVQAIAQ